MAKILEHIFEATPEWIEFLRTQKGIDWVHDLHKKKFIIECTSQQLVDLVIKFQIEQTKKR